MAVAYLLAIDAGNTRTKWAFFNVEGEIISQSVCLNSQLKEIIFFDKNTSCQHVYIANVAGEEIAKIIQAQCDAVYLTPQWAKVKAQSCGVDNAYDYPEKLGVDRWAALIAAWKQYQTSCLVVNVGTAVTIDRLHVKNKRAVFVGGVILPGLQLMQQALVHGTVAIPHEYGKINHTPTNTADAVYSGAFFAIVGAITVMMETSDEPVSKVLIGGGDAAEISLLLAQISNQAFSEKIIVSTHLVLQGLYWMCKGSACAQSY